MSYPAASTLRASVLEPDAIRVAQDTAIGTADGADAFADERALQRQASDLVLHATMHDSLRSMLPGHLVPPGDSDWPMQVFAATPDQVRAVRQFVRGHLTEHPTADDAVVVASELATNSIVHSASSQPGGQFLVLAAVTGDRQAALVVTDQGGPFGPGQTPVGRHGETGRGLNVVRSLASLFRICDHADGHRTFLAVINTASDASESSVTQAHSAERTRVHEHAR